MLVLLRSVPTQRVVPQSTEVPDVVLQQSTTQQRGYAQMLLLMIRFALSRPAAVRDHRRGGKSSPK